MAKEQPDYTDPDWLEHQYQELGKTTREIAEKTDVSHASIQWHMKKGGIEIRSKSEAERKKQNNPKLWDEEWLRSEYSNGKTMKQIADEIGVSMMSLYNAFERYDIERRGASERTKKSMEELYGDEKYRDKEWLAEQYWGEEKTLREIADECGCVESTIRNWMGEHGIDRRSPNGREDKGEDPAN